MGAFERSQTEEVQKFLSAILSRIFQVATEYSALPGPTPG